MKKYYYLFFTHRPPISPLNRSPLPHSYLPPPFSQPLTSLLSSSPSYVPYTPPPPIPRNRFYLSFRGGRGWGLKWWRVNVFTVSGIFAKTFRRRQPDKVCIREQRLRIRNLARVLGRGFLYIQHWTGKFHIFHRKIYWENVPSGSSVKEDTSAASGPKIYILTARKCFCLLEGSTVLFSSGAYTELGKTSVVRWKVCFPSFCWPTAQRLYLF